MRASSWPPVFQRGADGRQRVLLSSSAQKTELRPRRFGEWTGNPTHSLPLSVASHGSGMVVLWCTVHISSRCPHTFRYSQHNPHRVIVPLLYTVLTLLHRSQRPALHISVFRPALPPPGIPSTRTFVLPYCVFANHHRRLLLIAVKWLKNC